MPSWQGRPIRSQLSFAMTVWLINSDRQVSPLGVLANPNAAFLFRGTLLHDLNGGPGAKRVVTKKWTGSPLYNKGDRVDLRNLVGSFNPSSKGPEILVLFLPKEP